MNKSTPSLESNGVDLMFTFISRILYQTHLKDKNDDNHLSVPQVAKRNQAALQPEADTALHQTGFTTYNRCRL